MYDGILPRYWKSWRILGSSWQIKLRSHAIPIIRDTLVARVVFSETHLRLLKTPQATCAFALASSSESLPRSSVVQESGVPKSFMRFAMAAVSLMY